MTPLRRVVDGRTIELSIHTSRFRQLPRLGGRRAHDPGSIADAALLAVDRAAAGGLAP